MAIELMCRKIGMTQVFNERGESVPVTVLDAGPNTIVQKKTPEHEGYAALQLGFGERRGNLFSKPARGHFEKAGVAPKRALRESRLGASELEGHEVGGEITCELFEEGQRVDVIGTSKGRGTQGVVKRHGFSIKKKTHGTHEGFRNPGSIGAGAWPARVFKGQKMAGRMGNERVTTRNLEVIRVDAERSLLFVRGAVPGATNGIVCVRHAVASRR